MKSSQSVAREFLKLAHRAGRAFTLMQVLKLVYIAHGWMLALYRRPLIKDEVQAWQYGPTIPELYDKIRHYGGGPVEEVEGAEGEELDRYEADVVRQVYDLYGHMSGLALSSLTHGKNTPWHLTYDRKTFGLPIPNDLIEDYYLRLAS